MGKPNSYQKTTAKMERVNRFIHKLHKEVEERTPEGRDTEFYSELTDDLNDLVDDIVEDTDLAIDHIEEDIALLREGFNRLEKRGFNLDIMVYWLTHKTGVNIGDIRDLLDGQKQFFNIAFQPQTNGEE